MNKYNIHDPIGAMKFINRLYEMHMEGFNEMLPEWHNALVDSIAIVKDNIGKGDYDEVLNKANKCLEDMDIIKFRKIEL